MIKFALRCEPEGHAFDGWFRSGEDFDGQSARDLVACPVCGATSVGKGLMRPAVGATRSQSGPPEAARVMAALQEASRAVRAKADYVGPDFAAEARRIHFGEATPRQIYGEASLPEVKGLTEDGIAVMPLPALPEDQN